MSLTPEKRQTLDAIINEKGYTDYKWIDPKKIIVAQWVRMKCMFGCVEYGHSGACPPNTPSVAECERFFKEYTNAIILHFEGQIIARRREMSLVIQKKVARAAAMQRISSSGFWVHHTVRPSRTSLI